MFIWYLFCDSVLSFWLEDNFIICLYLYCRWRSSYKHGVVLLNRKIVVYTKSQDLDCHRHVWWSFLCFSEWVIVLTPNEALVSWWRINCWGGTNTNSNREGGLRPVALKWWIFSAPCLTPVKHNDDTTIVLTNEVITYDSKKHSVSFFTCTNYNEIK